MAIPLKKLSWKDVGADYLDSIPSLFKEQHVIDYSEIIEEFLSITFATIKRNDPLTITDFSYLNLSTNVYIIESDVWKFPNRIFETYEECISEINKQYELFISALRDINNYKDLNNLFRFQFAYSSNETVQVHASDELKTYDLVMKFDVPWHFRERNYFSTWEEFNKVANEQFFLFKKKIVGC